VELAHDFSLLHDDIMDRDTMRRHRPAAWVAYGEPLALLTGDALLVAAFDLVPEGPPAAAFRAAALELCAGQSADLSFEKRTSVGLPECLRMAEQKTAALLSLACRLGALSAGVDTRVADLYRQFGRHLGIAFQLIDDILGIWCDEHVTGKPVRSDLRSRKKTLPVAAALSSGTAAGDELAALLSRSEIPDDRAVHHAANLIDAAGGRDWAEAEALRHRVSALDALAEAEPEDCAAQDLQALAALMTARTW
jgi:geranylgeranyl diphosphate synthase type I